MLKLNKKLFCGICFLLLAGISKSYGSSPFEEMGAEAFDAHVRGALSQEGIFKSITPLYDSFIERDILDIRLGAMVLKSPHMTMQLSSDYEMSKAIQEYKKYETREAVILMRKQLHMGVVLRTYLTQQGFGHFFISQEGESQSHSLCGVYKNSFF